MPCLTFTPAAALSPFVESIYFISQSPVGPHRHLVTPNGFMDLVIHLENRPLSWFIGEDRYSVTGPLLAGPYSKPFHLDFSEFTSVLGVRFKPGAARLFFPIPAHELHNLDVALSDVYRIDADQLIDEVLSASPLQRQIRLLQRHLLAKLNGTSGVDAAVEHAVRLFRRPGNPASVADVEADVGLSHTRFIQLFRESVGMTPKLFGRVQRFQNAVRSIEAGAAVNWAELAADCGYFDQAHLIRDFRQFSGLTPLGYADRVQAYQRLAAAQ
jgi:AraC-like DNA-binding protein